MYEVIVSKEFNKSFKKLQKKLQERVRKILKKLEKHLIGIPLKGDLQGFYSVHFERNKYRLIYFKEKDIIQVLVVHVGKRTTNFYEEFKKELRKAIRKK